MPKAGEPRSIIIFKDDPTRESYTIEEWADIVKQQVQSIEERNGVSTVLMHPLCMHMADNFKTARRLFELFSQFKMVWAKEVGAFLKG